MHVCMYACIMHVCVYVCIHFHTRSFRALHSLTHSPVLADAVFDLDASTQTGGTVVDSIAKMQFSDMVPKADADNVKYFDLSQSSSSYISRKAGGTLMEGQYYTHAYVLKWAVNAARYRTLFRHVNDKYGDHCAITDSTSLGMYSSRNSGFRDSEYDIVPQQDHWDIVVVTGAGSSSTGFSGTTTFYTMDVSTGKMMLRGTADHVCSGMRYEAIGYPGQQSGKIARVVSWQRVLTMNEIQALTVELVGTATTCATGKYVKDNKCLDCPSGSTCDGTKATECATVKYVKDNQCLVCPSGSICDGTK